MADCAWATAEGADGGGGGDAWLEDEEEAPDALPLDEEEAPFFPMMNGEGDGGRRRRCRESYLDLEIGYKYFEHNIANR